MDIDDQTGHSIPLKDFEDAISVVTKCMIGPALLKLPPELAVQMGNIRRCLQQGATLTEIALAATGNRDGD